MNGFEAPATKRDLGGFLFQARRLTMKRKNTGSFEDRISRPCHPPEFIAAAGEQPDPEYGKNENRLDSSMNSRQGGGCFLVVNRHRTTATKKNSREDET